MAIKNNKERKTLKGILVDDYEDEIVQTTNYNNLFTIVLIAIVMGGLGYNLPFTLAVFNANNIIYGTWISYTIICLLFYLLVKDLQLTKFVEKERLFSTKFKNFFKL